MLPSLAAGSSLTWLRRALAALLMLLATSVRGEDTAGEQHILQVATADQLRAALVSGQKHIQLTKHINADESAFMTMQLWSADGRWNKFSVDHRTSSISGACDEEPGYDLAVDWTPGVCVVHVADHQAFHVARSHGSFWMHNVYILMTGNVVAFDGWRLGVNFMSNTDASDPTRVYLTNTTLEGRPSSALKEDQYFTVLRLTTQMGLSPIQILARDVKIIANYDLTIRDGDSLYKAPVLVSPLDPGNIPPQPNSTLSLVNSAFMSNATSASAPVMHAHMDTRMESTTISGSEGLFVSWEGQFAQQRRWYVDETFEHVDNSELPLKVLDLDESGPATRQDLGLPPFLTLDDPDFLQLQNEVRSGIPLPPNETVGAPTPTDALESPDEELQPESGPTTSASSTRELISAAMPLLMLCGAIAWL